MICWGSWDFSIHIQSALSSYRLCRCFQGLCYCQFVTSSWGRLEWVIDSFFPAYYEVVMITNYVGPLKVSEQKHRYVITLSNYRSFEDQGLGCMRRVNVVIVHTISKWLHWPFTPHCMNCHLFCCLIVLIDRFRQELSESNASIRLRMWCQCVLVR